MDIELPDIWTLSGVALALFAIQTLTFYSMS